MQPHRIRSLLLAVIFIIVTATSSQSLVAGGDVVILPVPQGGKPMAARTDAAGIIHLVFETDRGPQYAKSIDAGLTLQQTMPIVDESSRRPGLEFTIWDMAVSDDGTVHVVLGTNAWKVKLPKEEWGYLYTRRTPESAAFEPVRNLNHCPSEGFSVAAGKNRSVAAVWMADKLFGMFSDDGGKTFGLKIAIDPMLDPCNCCTTSAVFAADGRVALLYREETDNQRDMYLAFWDPKTNRATKKRVSVTGWNIDSCPMTYYSLIRSGDGFVATWPTKGDVHFARLSADGSLMAPKEVKTAGQSGIRTGVIGLPLTDGKTFVAWKKDQKVGWQLFDDRGTALKLPKYLGSSGNGVAATMNSKGDIVLFR